MQCTFCDAPLSPGARYCPNCGTSNPVGPPPEASPTPDKPHPFGTPPGWHDPYQAPASMYAAPSTSPTAVVSLISGLLAWFLFPGLGAIIAVITGHIALTEIRQSAGRVGGAELARVGLVLGYLQLALALLALLVVIVLFLGVGVLAIQHH
jgi:Domain of unknown function (DUF4190)